MVGRDRHLMGNESRGASLAENKPARLCLVGERRLRLVEADAPLPAPVSQGAFALLRPPPAQPRQPDDQPLQPALQPGVQPGVQRGPAIDDPNDPRWVLAVRAGELLEGPVLRPEKRERLIRVGKMLGLSPFDANLVIAIVQDQARRGCAPRQCAAAGEAQLRLVPLPRFEDSEPQQRLNRILRVSLCIAVAVVVELVVLKWIFS